MKNILLMCAAALIFFGCGKNNDPAPIDKPDYKALIIGKWGNQKDTIYEYTNNKLTHTTVVQTSSNEYTEYKADGIGNGQWSTLLTPFTYTLADKTITYKIPAIKENGTTYPPKQFNEEIKTLNKTQLVTYYENIDIDQQGNVYKEVEIDHYTKLSN